MRLLVKFPTRSRPQQFLRVITGYINLSTKKDIQYLISIDSNDPSMNNPPMQRAFNGLGNNVMVISGTSNSKIEACNRDIWNVKEWDILVLASDDMICQCPAWDEVLRREMKQYFPDTNGCLFHFDGDPATKRHNNGNGLCTMNIMGRKYYDSLGYVYHPSYISLWADNEYTEVAQLNGRMKYFDTVLFKHNHYANNPMLRPDQLMNRNQPS